ncbi:MAG TPA: glycosyltransferase [Candidatus Dormibacteraeota bacterium]|nr:glycosyltransferase [Candidatus Dormibacteraeota bacterium]
MTPPDQGRTPVNILLDCRWLGRGGAGRLTELLLIELCKAPPRGVWQLWGEQSRLEKYRFPGALIAPWSGDPTKLFGQSDLLKVPAHDLAIYLHQLRPLRPGPSITFVLDTIPLRFGRRPWLQPAKRIFLWTTCRLSRKIVTISEVSRVSVVRDLHTKPSKVVVTTLGIDPDRVARVRALRASSPRGDHVLFVGRFAEHKNLRRLVCAFQTTDFHRDGGRLILVGGTPLQVAELSAFAADANLTQLDIRPECTEDELDHLIATCRALVQPSLEEGYGLPAVEAAALGVQVAVSRTGYAPEIPPDLATFMDAYDVRSISVAVDQATRRPDSRLIWLPQSTVAADLIGVIDAVIGVPS